MGLTVPFMSMACVVVFCMVVPVVLMVLMVVVLRMCWVFGCIGHRGFLTGFVF
ncbi:MAG: hypothetical protein M3O74_01130 [Pseudomonadota bacterium]|jgi:hypothetical protein|nr:hypothetical protein [Pseudomonadota bacterium]